MPSPSVSPPAVVKWRTKLAARSSGGSLPSTSCTRFCPIVAVQAVDAARVVAGSNVIVVVPCPDVTPGYAMAPHRSVIQLGATSTFTASLNVKLMLSPTGTPVWPSVGLLPVTDGRMSVVYWLVTKGDSTLPAISEPALRMQYVPGVSVPPPARLFTLHDPPATVGSTSESRRVVPGHAPEYRLTATEAGPDVTSTIVPLAVMSEAARPGAPIVVMGL